MNIALVNEMAMLADRMGIDIWEAIEASATKPFGFMPFWPGPGLGGHCIPVDPFYLAWRAKAFDMDTEFVELAGRVNTNMPYYAVARIARALNERGRAVRRRGCCCWAWPTRRTWATCARAPRSSSWSCCARRAHVVVPRPARGHATGRDGLRAPGRSDIATADCVVIATAHKAVDLALVVEHAELVVDLRNAVRRRLAGRASGGVPPTSTSSRRTVRP